MRSWVWLVVMVGVGASCELPPSQEQVSCYQGCGREKDACMLEARTPPQLQVCDQRSSRCTVACQ